MYTLLYWFINGELIYFFSMRVQANWIEFIFSNCIKQNRENDNMDENQYNVEEDILKKRSIQFILYTCSLSRKEIKLYIVHQLNFFHVYVYITYLETYRPFVV